MSLITPTQESQYRQSLPPGTRWMLVGIAGVFLTKLLLQTLASITIISWLTLSPAYVWQGQIWRLLTYAFLAGELLELIMGLLSIAWLGASIERTWSRNELWTYACLCSITTGIIRCLLTPASTIIPGGLIVLVASLLVAWIRLAPHEPLQLPIFGPISRAKLALIFAVATLLLALVSGGLPIIMQGLLAAAIG